MRHPSPCRYDDSIGGGSAPDTDYCTCPKKGTEFCRWLDKRIAFTEGHMLGSSGNVPESIALGGKLRAYKEILEYVNTHGVK